jgi:predicted aspartyl protease
MHMVRLTLLGIGIAVAISVIAAAAASLGQTVCLRPVGGVYSVPAELNRQKVVPGKLDTGADDIYLVCEAAARELQLPRGNSVKVEGVGGTRGAYMSTLYSLRVGSIEHFDVAIVVVEDPVGPCRLLLGFPFFERHEFSIFAAEFAQLVAKGRRAPSKGWWRLAC